MKKDLTGKIFGRWEVLYEAEHVYSKKGKSIRVWHCRCTCDKHTEKDIRQASLLQGTSQSCGCMERKCCQNTRDLTGQQFGSWIVINEAPCKYKSSGQKIRMWNCECSCEFHTQKVLSQDLLVYGGSTKCMKCSHKGQKSYLRQYNTFDLSGECGVGYTSKGEEFFFDLEDYEKIKDYFWTKNDQGYIISSKRIEDTKRIRMHRLILGLTEEFNYNNVVDHIGGVNTRNDNRKQNLRIVTSSENICNQKLRKDNTSGVTGVCYDKSKRRWLVTIGINNKSIYIGSFINFEDAVAARKEAEDKYFGEYSYNNSQKIAELNNTI